MTISQVYSQYQIPPNLVRHQFEVAAVGNRIADHWKGRSIDRHRLTKALLLHDMGNIIKFKRPFLGELEQNAAFWEQVQQEFVQKYGQDVHTATIAILTELELDDVVHVVNEMKSVWAFSFDTVSELARIGEFADCCVTPDGIVGFAIRMTDLKNRYFSNDSKNVLEHMKQNADFVQKNVDIDLNSIQNFDYSTVIEHLRHFTI